MKRDYSTDYIAQQLVMYLTGTDNSNDFEENVSGMAIEDYWDQIEEHTKDDYRYAVTQMVKLLTNSLNYMN